MNTFRFLPYALGLGALVACGDDPPLSPFGETSIVVVVNAPENDGNTAGVPATFGTAQGDIEIDADPGGGDVTDATGLAVVTDLDVGNLSLIVDDGPSIPMSITSEGDVYDTAVAYDGTAAEVYPGFPIHYAIGGTVIDIATDADATEALNTDDTIVFFEDGIHAGSLVIQGSNVILFGEGFPDTSVVIEGDVEVRGGSVRLRGVTITGNLTVFGNGFGMSFSVVRGTTNLNGQAISFLGNVFCKGASVPSSNAALFDNEGLPPLAAPGAPICP